MNYELSVIIPVYNEEKTILKAIEKLLGAFKNNTSVQFIIVDDGSTDQTVQLLKSSSYLKNDNFIFIFAPKNQCKGAAIRLGLNQAKGEYTIIQDADLEYDPTDILKLLTKIKAEDLKVVYGSRNLNKANKTGAFHYYWGGRAVTTIANILFGQKLTDEPTCYKMFRTDFLQSMPLTCRKFEFCPEVTALVSLEKIRIPELPISYNPRSLKEGKKINWIDGLQAIWTLIRLRFQIKNPYLQRQHAVQPDLFPHARWPALRLGRLPRQERLLPRLLHPRLELRGHSSLLVRRPGLADARGGIRPGDAR